jgi:thiol-disulfide isomerase/thioredoxin
MKTSILFLSLCLSAASAWGEPAKMRSAEALSTSVDFKTQKFAAKLKAGYHFNDKAPNSLMVDSQKQALVSLSKQAIEFQLPKAWAQGSAALYVCDDAVTYCETHHLEIKGNGSAPAEAKSKSGSANASKSGKIGKHGFIEDDYQKALALAETQQKPVLIEFSARWCPGCVRYDKEVFSNPRFPEVSKNVVKLKIDVDRFENFAISEKYAIHGIPTMVVVDSKEQEINRLVDFQTLEGVQSFLQTIAKDPTPMKELLARPNPDSKTSLQLGLRLLASGQTFESLKYLEKVTPPPPELLQARVDAAKETYSKDRNKESYSQALRATLKVENQTTRSLGWRTELLSLLDSKSEEVKTQLLEGNAVAEKALQDPNFLNEAVKTETLGEFMGFEKLWVAMLRADLVEAAGQPEEKISSAWQEAAKIGGDYHISPSKSGPALRYLIVLSSAKQFEAAEKFANLILKHDPDNTDVKRRKLKVLLGLKKPVEAVKLGEKILPIAEGRNEFWVAETLAKAYIASERKVDAKRLLTAYLARPEISEEKMKSSKKSFEDLLKSTN